MASQRKTDSKKTPRRPPATTPEGRENQMVAMAVDLAEKQLRDGTATSQVLTHFLKLGSTREKLEQERLSQENDLLRAKIDAMASAKRVEELYASALDAMRSYAGQESIEVDDYDED